MTQQDQWGPWILHDGKGCPCVGMYVHVERANGDYTYGIAGVTRYDCIVSPEYYEISEDDTSWWDWRESEPQFGEVIRYRIRKPRGMTILEQLVKNPERELEGV